MARDRKSALADLEWLADLMIMPAALVPSHPKVPVHCNPALERMLAAESESGRRRFRRALDDLAHAMRAASAPEGQLRVRTSSRRYLLEPLHAPPGRAAGLIRVHRSRAVVPDPNVVASRFALTRREAEVAMLVASGLSNKSIATELGLSPHTVRRHTENVFRKVGVTSRTSLSARLHG